MNENQYWDYWSAHAAAAADKQREAAEYKRLLFTIAISVIIVTVIVQIAAVVVFLFLPVLPAHPDWPVFIAGLQIRGSAFASQDIAYFLLWLANDVVMYVPPLLAFGFIFRNRLDYQRPGRPYEFKIIWILPFFVAGLAIATATSFFTTIVAELFSGGSGEDVLPDVLRDVMPETNAQLLIMFTTVGVVAPICEEIIYRHLLLRPLRRFGDLQAVIITSILFGFFHGNLTQFLYTTMVGFILGIAAVKSNSVVPAIIIHMLNNIFVVSNSHLFGLTESSEASLGAITLGILNYGIFILGVVAIAIMAIKNILTVDDYNPHLFPGDRLRILVRRPSVHIMVVILILTTILGTVAQ